MGEVFSGDRPFKSLVKRSSRSTLVVKAISNKRKTCQKADFVFNAQLLPFLDIELNL